MGPYFRSSTQGTIPSRSTRTAQAPSRSTFRVRPSRCTSTSSRPRTGKRPGEARSRLTPPFIGSERVKGAMSSARTSRSRGLRARCRERIDERKFRKALEVLIGGDECRSMLEGECREVGIVDVVAAQSELLAETSQDSVVIGPRFDPDRHRVAAERLQKPKRVARGGRGPSEGRQSRDPEERQLNEPGRR